MRFPTLETGGKKCRLRHLDLTATLDTAIVASAVIWDRLDGLKKGQSATVVVAGRAFEMVVQSFHGPAPDGTSFQLIDPITAARAFHGEAFSDAKHQTTLEAAIASRVAVGGKGDLQGEKFPSVLMDGVSLRDALRTVCARKAGWHFCWNNGRVEIGPLPSADVAKLDVACCVPTSEGVEARIHGKLPALGSKVRVQKTEGHVLAMNIRCVDVGQPKVEVTVGAPEPVEYAAHKGTIFLPAVVEQIKPLFVRVTLPDGREAATRARLMSFHADKSRFRIAVPLCKGDQVQLAWPLGVFIGIPNAYPFDEVPAAESLELFAKEMKSSWDEWKHEAKKIDWTVQTEVHIHN